VFLNVIDILCFLKFFSKLVCADSMKKTTTYSSTLYILTPYDCNYDCAL